MGKPKKSLPCDNRPEKLDKLRSLINQQKQEILRLNRRIRELEKDFENVGRSPKVRQEQPKQTKQDKEALAEQKKQELKQRLKAVFGKKCKLKKSFTHKKK